VEVVADMQEVRERNGDQFGGQMSFNGGAQGDLPVSATRQASAEHQEDLLTESGTDSDKDPPDSPPACTRGAHGDKTPPSAVCTSPGAPRVDRASSSKSEVGASEAAAGSVVPRDHVTSTVRPRTRLQSCIVKPKVFTDGTIRYANFCATGEPENLTEALNSFE
jgi:hypothetical protein